MKINVLLTLIAVYLFVGLNSSLGQAPDLGTASTFALFTATGALSNVGSSTVVGDLGTNDGLYSGFNTATITGQSHISDPTSASAAADVVTAYNSLVATPCTVILASPELGNQTLTSGVYCQNTALPSTLTGTLTLSGTGIFIIKLSSALVTATNSSIVLTNGATAANVFFQILGAATLGTGSTFKGTIIAEGAIVLNTTTLEGRALSTVGAITVNESSITNVAVPLTADLVPIMYTLPTIQYGTTNFTVVVDVFDILSTATNNLITVYVTKDPLVVLSLNSSSVFVGNKTVQNDIWTFNDSNDNFYILTTNEVIAGGSRKSFGLTGVLTPGNTQGALTVSTTIMAGSGGEVNINNNSDADKIEYFKQ
ncbi:ice-binding family protein [Spirosoma jeollabukense]